MEPGPFVDLAWMGDGWNILHKILQFGEAEIRATGLLDSPHRGSRSAGRRRAFLERSGAGVVQQVSHSELLRLEISEKCSWCQIVHSSLVLSMDRVQFSEMKGFHRFKIVKGNEI